MNQPKTNLSLAISLIFFVCMLQFVAVPSAESVTYTYDEANRLLLEEDGTGTVIEYIYDDEGNLTEKTLGSSGITHTVTPSAGPNGTISPSTPQTVEYNSTTSFTVTPDPGYQIESVTGCGGTLTGDTYTTGPITADCTVTASFAESSITYTVTPSVGSNGTITPSTPQTVNHNATTSFTVTPDTGYSIASVTGCGGTLTGNIYTTGPITADCTVTASFAASSTYSISGRVTTDTGDPLSKVTMTLSGGDDPVTTKTASDGSYSFTDLCDGTSYTITPSKRPYTFIPPNAGAVISGADVTGVDFTGTR